MKSPAQEKVPPLSLPALLNFHTTHSGHARTPASAPEEGGGCAGADRCQQYLGAWEPDDHPGGAWSVSQEAELPGEIELRGGPQETEPL